MSAEVGQDQSITTPVLLFTRSKPDQSIMRATNHAADPGVTRTSRSLLLAEQDINYARMSECKSGELLVDPMSKLG
jgi:hypothetical protein